MDMSNISETTYKEAFEIMSVAMNEVVGVIMSAITRCDDLFMTAMEKQGENESIVHRNN